LLVGKIDAPKIVRRVKHLHTELELTVLLGSAHLYHSKLAPLFGENMQKLNTGTRLGGEWGSEQSARATNC
jgi:hypothetical protein